MELPVLSAARSRFAALATPVDNAILVWLRVTLGTILLWEVVRYQLYGWIHHWFILPRFHFTYHGFSWVEPWPGWGMYAHFAVLGLLTVAMAVGFHYRLVAALFAPAFIYVFLLEQANYMNHLYFVCLLSVFLPFLPAHRAVSLDVRREPGLRTDWAPAWTLWLLRAHVAIVYLYGGLAKIDGDWLLHAQPLRLWMEQHGQWPVVGPLLAWDGTAWLMSWAGLLIDLLAAPLLLWRRTRPFMLAVLVAFHVLNMFFWEIGIFPYMMIALTLVFLEPDWPRRAFPRLFGARTERPRAPARLTRRQAAGMAVLAVYFFFQLAFPFRHHLYPGKPSWTSEGYRFAWLMMLRSIDTDLTVATIDRATGQSWRIDPLDLLTPVQAQRMSRHPDMIVQFAHHVADRMEERGHPDVEVRVRALASLNGRPRQHLVDPEVDLSRVERRVWPPADWIVPLESGPPP